jgi:hypothetical protein
MTSQQYKTILANNYLVKVIDTAYSGCLKDFNTVIVAVVVETFVVVAVVVDDDTIVVVGTIVEDAVVATGTKIEKVVGERVVVDADVNLKITFSFNDNSRNRITT